MKCNQRHHSLLSFSVPKTKKEPKMFKAIVLCSLVVFANAGLLPAYEHGHDDHHAPAHYDFSYSVHDGHTGDVKEQQESRRGDTVQGSSSLVEPDGHKRIVHYAADPHTGFNAVVQREGTAHPAPVAHVAHAAPIAVAHAAPIAVAHAAPAYAHAAPVAHVAHAPLAVAHAAPSYALAAPAYSGYSHGHGAVSHQQISTPVLAHAGYAHAPAQVAYAHAAPAQVAYAHAPAHQVAYAAPAYGHNAGYGAHGYSTVSQVTHHNAYHH